MSAASFLCELPREPMASIPQDRSMLYSLLFLSGIRLGEALALKWGRWDRSLAPLSGFIIDTAWQSTLREETTTKTHVVRAVPVHPALERRLVSWERFGFRQKFGRPPRPSDLIVPTKGRNHRRGQLVHRDNTNVNRDLKKDCQTLGYEPRPPVSFRRSFRTIARRDGAKSEIIERICRLRESDVASLYQEVSYEDMCAEVLKIRFTVDPRRWPI